MTLKTDIDQLAADAVLMHQVVHGDVNTIVNTAGGPVRSVAKLIADKDAEVNVAAGGILAQSVAQVGFATQQAVAAGNALSQINIAVAQAINAAGTASQYSTALAAVASQTTIVPAATVPGFNGIVVASCIDDTCKWSDGGAARKRTQNTSWYNEVTTATGKNLGKLASLAAAWAVTGAAVGDHYYDTTTKLFYSIGGTSAAPTRAEIFRGPRKDYPETVFWTAEAGRVIGWDATDSSFPMWMVFKQTGPASFMGMIAEVAVSCIAAINGQLLVGDTTYDLYKISFINDAAYQYGTAYIGSNWVGNISQRMQQLGYFGSTLPNIVNRAVNSVAATVLPNSPIDPATGLSVPTIAVGTNGGVSIIKDDGSVVNITFLSWGICGKVAFGGKYLFFRSGNSASIGCYFGVDVSVLTASFAHAAHALGPTFFISDYELYSSPSSTPCSGAAYAYSAGGTIAASGFAINKVNPKTAVSLMLSQSLLAAITKAFNSGWMSGDIRGAWLADTAVETVSGAELVPLGAFNASTDISIWLNGAIGATVTWNAGVLDTVSSAVSNELGGITFAAVVGKTYRISYNRAIGFGVCYSSGTNTPILTSLDTAANMFTFVATSISPAINWSGGGASSHATFDNIFIIECAADRSVNAIPLKVVGMLTKSAVAIGSQLTAYSGFGAVNYLEQPYSAKLNFGVGDFCVMGWVNRGAAGFEVLYDRTQTVNALGVLVSVTNATGKLHTTFNGVTFDSTGAIASGSWAHFCLRRVGTTATFYINGALDSSITSAAIGTTVNGTTCVLQVGYSAAYGVSSAGALALLRSSATAPSVDQIAYIYETERKLFEPGAQCCIAGTSTVITAMDYDDSTDLLSAATNWGVTEFQGLEAINSYATTVGAPSAISTRGGYKLLSGATGSSFYKPSRLLAEELTRTYEQRKAFGSTPICKVFDAIAGQTDFTLGLKETPTELVYVAGVWKRIGATKEYTVVDDGFRKTLRFNVSPGAVEVAIFYVKEL